MKVGNKPPWIRYRIPSGPAYLKVKRTVSGLGLHTICTEAGCPNCGECFALGTATFLILGDTCTRDCAYCAVKKGAPLPPDMDEPGKVARAVQELELKYAVITSVTRDDLPDGGASLFAETCRSIESASPGCRTELLVPDFSGSMEKSLEVILREKVHILNHNIETVKEFFPLLRPSGSYRNSLELLRLASGMGALVKSGIMVGFGETKDEIRAAMDDLVKAGCGILTIGQYLKPGRNFFEVARYYHPDEFEELKRMGMDAGFHRVVSGPNVRSSYHAAEISTPGDNADE